MAKPREVRWGWCAQLYVRAAMALCLVSAVVQARAMAVAPLEMQAVAVPDMEPARMPPMPAAADCTPCAACYVAPAPVSHGFNGDDQPPIPNPWFALRPVTSSTTAAHAGCRSVALPVRIVFCRWLD